MPKDKKSIIRKEEVLEHLQSLDLQKLLDLRQSDDSMSSIGQFNQRSFLTELSNLAKKEYKHNSFIPGNNNYNYFTSEISRLKNQYYDKFFDHVIDIRLYVEIQRLRRNDSELSTIDDSDLLYQTISTKIDISKVTDELNSFLPSAYNLLSDYMDVVTSVPLSFPDFYNHNKVDLLGRTCCGYKITEQDSQKILYKSYLDLLKGKWRENYKYTDHPHDPANIATLNINDDSNPRPHQKRKIDTAVAKTSNRLDDIMDETIKMQDEIKEIDKELWQQKSVKHDEQTKWPDVLALLRTEALRCYKEENNDKSSAVPYIPCPGSSKTREIKEKRSRER